MTISRPFELRRVVFSLTIATLIASAVLVFTPIAWAQQEASAPAADPAPAAETSVTVADAQAFLGYWMLSAKLGERNLKMGLVLTSALEDGDPDRLAGRLVSAFGEMKADRFRRNGDKLGFDLSSNLGTFLLEIEVADNEILGNFSDEGASFTADFTGTKSDRQAFQQFMKPDNETRIAKGDDTVIVRFARPKAGERDYQQIETLEPGQVVSFLEDAAIKLMTDLDLEFGPTGEGALAVKTANVAPGYRGVYSLWLKRTETGWSLAFNPKADVWGTQHEAEFDVGEVALQQETAAEPSERLEMELVESDGAGILSMTWGPHRWTAPFRIASAKDEQPAG